MTELLAHPHRLMSGVLAATTLLGVGGALAVGSLLIAPSRRAIGPPPPALQAETVHFQSGSGATLAAWFAPADEHGAVVVLSHGVRGSRADLAPRARFLREAGYGLLLYDAQAHGESTGDAITFGHLEAHDAAAAVRFVRGREPEVRIGFIGPSLAGASALLGPAAGEIDALVLEAVYPTLRQAVFNRVNRFVGSPIARILTPMLLWQVGPRLGFDPDRLNPIDRIGQTRTPLFLIAGSDDRHTTLRESRSLYAAAHQPKEMWVVEGATHQSFHAFAKAEYERRVLGFFDRHLRTTR